MSNKLTYIEARDKIWNAYFRDEIKPLDPNFCFCGTLNDKKSDWCDISVPFYRYKHNYGKREYAKMESALLKPLRPFGAERSGIGAGSWGGILIRRRGQEDAIFAGMLAALEVLKQIHRDRGDFIPEDEPLLTKRNKQPSPQ